MLGAQVNQFDECRVYKGGICAFAAKVWDVGIPAVGVARSIE